MLSPENTVELKLSYGNKDTLKYKSMHFSVRMVKLYTFLCEQRKEYTISKQIMRSATSIGANIAESEVAMSEKDFLNKRYIAFKECNETIYWLQLLFECDYIGEKMFFSLYNDCNEIRKMLSSSTKTMKNKLANIAYNK